MNQYITETVGVCGHCYKLDQELANGYCVACWDKALEAPKLDREHQTPARQVDTNTKAQRYWKKSHKAHSRWPLERMWILCDYCPRRFAAPLTPTWKVHDGQYCSQKCIEKARENGMRVGKVQLRRGLKNE